MASLQFYFPFSHFNVFSRDLWNDLIKQLLAVPQLVLFSVVRRWKMLFHVNHLEMIILVEDMFVLETIARFYVYFCLRMWICHLFPFHLLRQLFNWICERVFSLSSFVYFHFYIFFCFFLLESIAIQLVGYIVAHTNSEKHMFSLTFFFHYMLILSSFFCTILPVMIFFSFFPVHTFNVLFFVRLCNRKCMDPLIDEEL